MPDSPHAAPTDRRPDYQAAIDFLYGRIDYERATGDRKNHEFRLERTVQLFHKLGLAGYLNGRPECESRDQSATVDPPSPKVPLIHIAGTKGKGSTATMVSAILTAGGYRVGLYTSPHLTDLEERFRIDGTPCSQQALIDLVKRVTPAVNDLDSADQPVSFFELTTAMAVLYFDLNDCDVIVLEVGLGGRLDSTNVCASSVAAITSIGLDHQRVLGSTHAEIATEKAGIIKSAVPVVSGVTQSSAVSVVRQAAANAGSQIFEIGTSFDVLDARESLLGSKFIYRAKCDQVAQTNEPRNLAITLGLDGKHQIKNAAVAITIVRVLCNSITTPSISVSENQITQALGNVECSGRVERFYLDQQPPIQIILDTAHNRDSMRALRNALANNLNQEVIHHDSKIDQLKAVADGQISRPIVAVFGSCRDKDVTSMVDELSQVADEIVCTQFTTNPRSVDVQQLSQALESRKRETAAPFPKRHVHVDPYIALNEAIRIASDSPAGSPGGTVVICGSFFLAGQLRPAVLNLQNVRPLRTSGDMPGGGLNDNTSGREIADDSAHQAREPDPSTQDTANDHSTSSKLGVS